MSEMRTDITADPPTPTALPFALPTSISSRDFRAFQTLVYEHSGINLSDAKRALVISRLGRRLRATGIHSFREYFDHVTDPKHDRELVLMFDAITTNETAFFREPKQFEFLERFVFPGWVQQGMRGERPKHIRVWSAACSTGEEPYSLAMFLMYHFPATSGWTVEVIASDLSTFALERADRGIWPLARTLSIPERLRRRFMMRGVRSREGEVAAGEQLRSAISFSRINLNDAHYPVRGQFDLLFVRNVFIYFSAVSRKRAVSQLLQHLAPGGYFMVGHAESLTTVCSDLNAARPTVYSWPNVVQALDDPRVRRGSLLCKALFDDAPQGGDR